MKPPSIFAGEFLQYSFCRGASRPCTPGSISYREEMDERRAKNLLVGFRKLEKLHERGKPLLKPLCIGSEYVRRKYLLPEARPTQSLTTT